jgi:hypothetical protein
LIGADTDDALLLRFFVQSVSIAQRIKQLQDEIMTIEEAIRKYRKIKHPGYPAQKAYEDRRIRLVEIQQEILALLKSRSN